MKISKHLICLLLIVLSSVSRATASDYPLYSSPNQVPAEIDVTLHQNNQGSEVLSLHLPVNYSTGADWRIEEFKAGEVQVKTENVTPSTVEISQFSNGKLIPVVGRPEVEALTLPVLTPGAHTYKLVYGRRWESNSWKTTLLNVTVVTP